MRCNKNGNNCLRTWLKEEREHHQIFGNNCEIIRFYFRNLIKMNGIQRARNIVKCFANSGMKRSVEKKHN